MTGNLDNRDLLLSNFNVDDTLPTGDHHINMSSLESQLQTFDYLSNNQQCFKNSLGDSWNSASPEGQNSSSNDFDISQFGVSDFNQIQSDHHSSHSHQPAEFNNLLGFSGSTNTESHALVMNCSSSHFSAYTTIGDTGQVYKHTSDTDSNYAGYINDRSVYNSSGYYQGYGGTNGKIYDHNDHCVGWVDSCGDVYNTSGVNVYHTTKGVVGGAAYILLVYHGGVN